MGRRRKIKNANEPNFPTPEVYEEISCSSISLTKEDQPRAQSIQQDKHVSYHVNQSTVATKRRGKHNRSPEGNQSAKSTNKLDKHIISYEANQSTGATKDRDKHVNYEANQLTSVNYKQFYSDDHSRNLIERSTIQNQDDTFEYNQLEDVPEHLPEHIPDEYAEPHQAQPDSGTMYPVNLLTSVSPRRESLVPRPYYEGSYFDRARTTPLSSHLKHSIYSTYPSRLSIDQLPKGSKDSNRRRRKGKKGHYPNTKKMSTASTKPVMSAIPSGDTKYIVDHSISNTNVLSKIFKHPQNMKNKFYAVDAPTACKSTSLSKQYLGIGKPAKKKLRQRNAVIITIAGTVASLTVFGALIGAIITSSLPDEKPVTVSPTIVLSSETSAFFVPTLPTNQSTLAPAIKGSKLGELNI